MLRRGFGVVGTSTRSWERRVLNGWGSETAAATPGRNNGVAFRTREKVFWTECMAATDHLRTVDGRRCLRGIAQEKPWADLAKSCTIRHDQGS